MREEAGSGLGSNLKLRGLDYRREEERRERQAGGSLDINSTQTKQIPDLTYFLREQT